MDSRPSKRMKTMPLQPARASLMELNYDCIRYVFSYLNARDLMYLEKVCKRFKSVAQDLYKTHRELDISKNIDRRRRIRGYTCLSTAEAEKIFRRVGPYIETLRLSEREIHGTRPLRFIWKYCKNLKAVYFYKIDFRHDEYAINLQPVFQNVTIAHMIHCYDLTDYRLATMFDLNRLKVLHIPGYYSRDIEGTFLEQLHNIEEFNLENSILRRPNLVFKFFQLNTSLRSLNINYCTAVEEGCLWTIATNLVNLECLTLFMDLFVSKECYFALMDLPKLKKFKIYYYCKETVWDIGLLFSQLAAHNRLECLDITFNHKNVTPETWGAIRSFTNLKELDICEIECCPHMELLGMSSKDTLEVLGVSYTGISNLGIEKLIENFKNIRTIRATNCKKLTKEFIPNIMKHLAARRHKLTIEGWFPNRNVSNYNRDLLEFKSDKIYNF